MGSFAVLPPQDAADGIGEKPADGDRRPDAGHADGGGGREQIGQGHAGAQGADRQHQRHRRPVHRPEVAVEQEQNADAQVAAALDAEVARAHGNDFLRVVPHENGQQLGGEAADQPADQQTKDQYPEQGPFRPGFDAPPLPGPVVLGDEGGVGVAEVLHGHVGQGVDLHRHGEGRHDDRAEGVHQALHQEDPEVHHRLLQAGEEREAPKLPQNIPVPPPVFRSDQQVRAALPGPQGQAHPGGVLGQHRRQRRAHDAHLQGDDEEQVQADVPHDRHAQKQQRRHRVPDGPEQIGEVIVEEGGRDARKHPDEIGPG